MSQANRQYVYLMVLRTDGDNVYRVCQTLSGAKDEAEALLKKFYGSNVPEELWRNLSVGDWKTQQIWVKRRGASTARITIHEVLG